MFKYLVLLYINSGLCLNVHNKDYLARIVTPSQNANMPGATSPGTPSGQTSGQPNSGQPPGNSQAPQSPPSASGTQQNPGNNNPPPGMQNGNQITPLAAEWVTGGPSVSTTQGVTSQSTSSLPGTVAASGSSTSDSPSSTTTPSQSSCSSSAVTARSGSSSSESPPTERTEDKTSSINGTSSPDAPPNNQSLIKDANIMTDNQKSVEEIEIFENLFEEKCEHFQSQVQYTPQNSKLQVTIVGGQLSKDKEFPHMAALGYGDNSNTQWLCGGSLISENYVITAAHCLMSTSLGNVRYVKLGSANLQSTENTQEFSVIGQLPHPGFNAQSQTLYNDIALIQLDRSVTITEYVSPICIWSSNDYGDRNLIATGWGRTDTAGPTSQILQKVGLELFSQSECQQAYSVISRQQLPNGIEEASQICAGSRSERKDTCQGDSGGPLQIRSNRKWYLIGITSFGIACGTNAPGVYTRIAYYTEWIQNVIWNK